MTRTGLFKYVLHERVYDYFERGWMTVAELGRLHGQYSVLMWHCECGEVLP